MTDMEAGREMDDALSGIEGVIGSAIALATENMTGDLHRDPVKWVPDLLFLLGRAEGALAALRATRTEGEKWRRTNQTDADTSSTWTSRPQPI